MLLSLGHVTVRSADFEETERLVKAAKQSRPDVEMVLVTGDHNTFRAPAAQLAIRFLRSIDLFFCLDCLDFPNEQEEVKLEIEHGIHDLDPRDDPRIRSDVLRAGKLRE